METVALIVLAFVVLGVVLAVRERRTGRGAITVERPVGQPQTEADRETIRAQDVARNHASGWHHH